MTEYALGPIKIRLASEPDLLIVASILPADGTKKLMESTVGRRQQMRENVQTLENKDVIIENIPMFDQGTRGYCAIGTLAMITQYYGLNVNIEQLAAKGGYKEGDVSNASVIPIYQAAAKEAKLRMTQGSKFDFRDAMREIERGRPVLVWRYFSYPRNAVHTRFKAAYDADPTATLPDPRKDKTEKSQWPKPADGGHASLITGFNKERDEVLFTESWGEEKRHRRMRAEEMEATCYAVFGFEPP